MFRVCRRVKIKQKNLKLIKRAERKLNNSSLSGSDGKNFTIKLSTTRGIPSTSTDLKEALCEKIPLHHDLLRKFRQLHGPDVVSQITVNDIYCGLSGVPALFRETSEVDSKDGVKYRGLSIPELFDLLPRRGNSPSPEAVFWLLLTGDIPTVEQTDALTADWTSRRDQRKDWWWSKSSSEIGGLVGSVLKALPSNVTPVGKLAIALTALDADRHYKRAVKDGVMSYSYWEHIYEDSMELLASLPAIVALVSCKEVRPTQLALEKADWVEFFLDCLHNTASENITEAQKKSLGDFLRLYIALNADDDGGIPGTHVAQIMGSCQYDASRALAAGVLAYANEPVSGTLCQYMDFLVKAQNAVGREPKKDTLHSFVNTLVEKRFQIAGHKIAQFEDSRYTVLQQFVKNYVPNDPEIKLSQDLSSIYTRQLKTARNRSVVAEQVAIAAPLFQFYGLRDMNYNQLLLCMSRALGIVASMIWTSALNAPVERPRSKCTHSYFSDFQEDKSNRRGKTSRNPKSPIK